MAKSAAVATESEQLTVPGRPQGQLHDLPLKFRWEVTRRHPYYLVFWRNALRYRQGEMGEEPEHRMLRYAAHMMLGTIGVTGQPVSPDTSFDQLDDDSLDPAFLSGAVQPITLRTVATTLIHALPPAELAVLGALFMNAGSEEYSVEGDDDRRFAQKMKAVSQFVQIPSPALDSYPDSPLFYIHLGASQRTIVDDVENQVRRWKKRRGIGERRVHTDKLPLYLKVWDLREGWTGDAYDLSAEHSFREIATKLGEPVSRIAHRYRAGFQMITGHGFSPDLWRRLFGPLKLSTVFQDAELILSAPMRHHLSSPVRRPVPDSVVSSSSNDASTAGVVEQGSSCADDHEFVDQWLDAQELFAQGLSDEEIAERLECDLDTVAYFRGRFEEFSR